MEVRELDLGDLERVQDMLTAIFSREPWNDHWEDRAYPWAGLSTGGRAQNIGSTSSASFRSTREKGRVPAF